MFWTCKLMRRQCRMELFINHRSTQWFKIMNCDILCSAHVISIKKIKIWLFNIFILLITFISAIYLTNWSWAKQFFFHEISKSEDKFVQRIRNHLKLFIINAVNINKCIFVIFVSHFEDHKDSHCYSVENWEMKCLF